MEKNRKLTDYFNRAATKKPESQVNKPPEAVPGNSVNSEKHTDVDKNTSFAAKGMTLLRSNGQSGAAGRRQRIIKSSDDEESDDSGSSLASLGDVLGIKKAPVSSRTGETLVSSI